MIFGHVTLFILNDNKTRTSRHALCINLGNGRNDRTLSETLQYTSLKVVYLKLFLFSDGFLTKTFCFFFVHPSLACQINLLVSNRIPISERSGLSKKQMKKIHNLKKKNPPSH